MSQGLHEQSFLFNLWQELKSFFVAMISRRDSPYERSLGVANEAEQHQQADEDIEQ